ncbi:HEAT repeat domain-containing protein [Tundrisphaera lichenicola]|uniref:HEAT repeat domain-containing protein n=1 Tax=Tundrisphaera lichenicola TaxID=2029860 RepID=UPI003EC027E2
MGEQEGADLVAVLDGLRAGFLKFAPIGRASAVSAAGYILDHLAIEPAPRSWQKALPPIHDLMVAGLADPNVDVRGSSLTEVGRHWNWLPGRTMTPAEEMSLAEWKDAFYKPASRCLGDREPKSRAAAVFCIGSLPIDSMAAPAAAYVDDPESGGVRYKAMMTFASRPNLLNPDSLLKRLHDREPGIPELAEMILKGRGLNKDQILLGRQIFDPRPEVRVAVVPLLRDRTDIDPVVWLLQLSHDSDENVREKAVEALVDRESPDVDRRLREVASTDVSPKIRATAGKHVAKTSDESTASLPPLPGSPSLNLKAN